MIGNQYFPIWHQILWNHLRQFVDLMVGFYSLLIILFQGSKICTLQQIPFVKWSLLSLISLTLFDLLAVYNCLQIFVSKLTLALYLTTLNISLNLIPIYLCLDMFPHHWVCNWLNFADSVSCKRLEFSTRSSDPPSYIHTITPEMYQQAFLSILFPMQHLTVIILECLLPVVVQLLTMIWPNLLKSCVVCKPNHL